MLFSYDLQAYLRNIIRLARFSINRMGSGSRRKCSRSFYPKGTACIIADHSGSTLEQGGTNLCQMLGWEERNQLEDFRTGTPLQRLLLLEPEYFSQNSIYAYRGSIEVGVCRKDGDT